MLFTYTEKKSHKHVLNHFFRWLFLMHHHEQSLKLSIFNNNKKENRIKLANFITLLFSITKKKRKIVFKDLTIDMLTLNLAYTIKVRFYRIEFKWEIKEENFKLKV